MPWLSVRIHVSCLSYTVINLVDSMIKFVLFSLFYLRSEGGVLYVVNGPNRDQDLYVPIQGFTIRVSDKAVLQTWPSNIDQVTTLNFIEIACVVVLAVSCLFLCFIRY